MTDQFDPTEMFWREEKDSHIKTIVYEIRMLRFSLSWLVKNGTQYRPEEELYAGMLSASLSQSRKFS